MAEFWVWVRPAEGGGVKGVAFSIDYPANVIPEYSVMNEEIIVVYMGDLVNGIEVAFSCLNDWGWLFKQTFWITSGLETAIRIQPIWESYDKVLYLGCRNVSTTLRQIFFEFSV